MSIDNKKVLDEYREQIRWVVLATCSAVLLQLYLPSDHWMNEATLFNVFSLGRISMTDYSIGVLSIVLGFLLGMLGLNLLTDGITKIRLAEVWDDFNNYRIEKKVSPENILLGGFISDYRVAAYVDAIMGLVNVAFFGVCFLQGCITIKLFRPLTDKYMVDTMLWTSGLFLIMCIERAVTFLHAVSMKKKIGTLKRALVIFPRSTFNELLEIFDSAEFSSGPHEAILILSNDFMPEIYPNRQIAFELNRIAEELRKISDSKNTELSLRCEVAMAKYDIIAYKNAIEFLIRIVVCICAAIGLPFTYYHAALSFRLFGGFSYKLAYWADVIRNGSLVIDTGISYFVTEPALETVEVYRGKKLNKID